MGTMNSVLTKIDSKLSVSEMDLYSESLMTLDKRHGRTQPNQDGRNCTQSSKQLYSLEMLSERLNLWIFILFGRGFSSVNRTDFVQHMLRKKFGSTLKIQAWKLNLAKKKGGGGSLKCFGAFRRKSILKLVQRIEKRLYELSDCCFSKCQHGNPNRKRWIGSLERLTGKTECCLWRGWWATKNCQECDDKVFPGTRDTSGHTWRYYWGVTSFKTRGDEYGEMLPIPWVMSPGRALWSLESIHR